MGASASKIIDSTILLMVSSERKAQFSRKVANIASNGFLRVVNDHVPRHPRDQSVFTFSRFTVPDQVCIHPVAVLGPEEFLSIVC